MKFLDGLSEDIRKNLLEQLRVLWTHTSTAIEGNTLTLGETAFVLSEGLTINGKSLKDHRDIEGHARAVDLMYALVAKDEIAATDLFDLHRLVINEEIFDVYKPIGGWKKENNSVNVTLNNRLTAIEFSDHWEVPELMERWLQLLNAETKTHKDPQEVLKSYAEVARIFCGHTSLLGRQRQGCAADRKPSVPEGGISSDHYRKGKALRLHHGACRIHVNPWRAFLRHGAFARRGRF